MRDVNKITLTGLMADPPRVSETNDGRVVANLSLMVREDYVSGGEQRTSKVYIKATCWGELAREVEAFEQYDEVLVDGKLTVNEYEDKQGVKRYEHRVTAFAVRRLATHDDAPAPHAVAAPPPIQPTPPPPTRPAARRGNRKTGPEPVAVGAGANGHGEDIPF